jgi:hypothetical protein
VGKGTRTKANSKTTKALVFGAFHGFALLSKLILLPPPFFFALCMLNEKLTC